MSVKAKFYVTEVAKTLFGSRVALQAVTRGEDNKTWAAATPVGKIEMTILNELAAEQFEPGEEFYVTFDPAEKGVEG